MSLFLSRTLFQLFLIIHESIANKVINYNNSNRGWEDARKILQNYTRAFDCRGFVIDTFFHPDFALTLCRKNERTYNIRDMFRGLYTAPYWTIRLHEMEITHVRLIGARLEFTAKPVVNGISLAVIDFVAVRKSDGEYELKKQVETDCYEDVYTSAMINYEKTAEGLARDIMVQYVDAISQRSLPRLYNLFNGRKSYRLKYCDGDYSISELTYRDFDLRMPFLHKSEIHEKYFTTITNARMKIKDGSIVFEVHGGAFNNIFVATKHFDRDYNAISFLLEFDYDMGCRYSPSKPLDLNELQYSVFF